MKLPVWRRRRLVTVGAVEVLVVQVRGLGGEEVRAAAERRRDRVRVLPLVRGDHHRRVLERPLHTLLHHALLRRAPVVAPWIWAVLDGLLTVLAPPVAVLEVVDLALGHEGETRLPRTLLALASLAALARRRPEKRFCTYVRVPSEIIIRSIISASKMAESYAISLARYLRSLHVAAAWSSHASS